MREYDVLGGFGHVGLLEQLAAVMSDMQREAAGEGIPSPFCNLGTEHPFFKLRSMLLYREVLARAILKLGIPNQA